MHECLSELLVWEVAHHHLFEVVAEACLHEENLDYTLCKVLLAVMHSRCEEGKGELHLFLDSHVKRNFAKGNTDIKTQCVDDFLTVAF